MNDEKIEQYVMDDEDYAPSGVPKQIETDPTFFST
jgi:hypothetical protein